MLYRRYFKTLLYTRYYVQGIVRVDRLLKVLYTLNHMYCRVSTFTFLININLTLKILVTIVVLLRTLLSGSHPAQDKNPGTNILLLYNVNALFLA